MCLPFNNSDLLEIGIPPTLGQVVRVAHPVSVNRTLVTNFASLRHNEKTLRFLYLLAAPYGACIRSAHLRRQVAPTLKSQIEEYSIWSAALSRLDVLQWPLFFMG